MVWVIKSNKKIQFLLIGFSIIVILLVYCAYFINETKEDVSVDLTNVEFDKETQEYVSTLENKLSNVLSGIVGAGSVDVAITVSSGFTYEYAYEETSKDSLSSTTSSSSLMLVDGKPVIISKEYPEISGILVVAEGGGDIKVKLEILESIQTLLDVPNENITILNGEF